MQRLQPLVCPECGETFTSSHHIQRFCSKDHQRAFHRRNAMRGKMILPLLLTELRGVLANRRYAKDKARGLIQRWAREDQMARRSSELVVEQNRVSEER